VQPVGERHRGDIPLRLPRQDAVHGGIHQPGREHAGPGHQEGGGEPVGLRLRRGPRGRDLVLAVQYQVPELVRRVEPAALPGLASAEEHKRLPVPVKRVRVKSVVMRGK